MATFTATANTASTIGYATYGGSSWNTGSSNGACQGAYQNTNASSSRVGVMVFSGAGTTLKNAVIKKITLKITCSAAGGAGDTKVLSFKKAKIQKLDTTVKGSDQAGEALGELKGKFYDNTVTHTLDASTNSELFKSMAAYLRAGNSALVLYNGEKSSSTTTYSSNYARVSSCVITVTYDLGTVWYNVGGTWKECLVYYCQGSEWKQCIPYYCVGSTWTQV